MLQKLVKAGGNVNRYYDLLNRIVTRRPTIRRRHTQLRRARQLVKFRRTNSRKTNGIRSNSLRKCLMKPRNNWYEWCKSFSWWDCSCYNGNWAPNSMPICTDYSIGHRREGFWGFGVLRSEEHTSELQSLDRISYAVFCLDRKSVV